jgi:hypothetical protein
MEHKVFVKSKRKETYNVLSSSYYLFISPNGGPTFLYFFHDRTEFYNLYITTLKLVDRMMDSLERWVINSDDTWAGWPTVGPLDYQRLHGRPQPRKRLPSSEVSTTTFSREAPSSSFTSSLVLTSTSWRVPRLKWVRTVGWISRTVTASRLWNGSGSGPAPVRSIPGMRPLAASGRWTCCSCRGSFLRWVASFPLLAAGSGTGGRHLLNQIQHHFRVNMRLWMNRIRPSGSEGLLNPVFAAAGSTDQLNPVQDGGRR